MASDHPKGAKSGTNGRVSAAKPVPASRRAAAASAPVEAKRQLLTEMLRQLFSDAENSLANADRLLARFLLNA